MNGRLYRIVLKTTKSVQPGTTFWSKKVLYCGYGREEARRIYHENELLDDWRGYGSSARETVCEVIDDAGTDNFEDDPCLEEST